MKSRIKQITLLDGKQLFYPSEEEVGKLWDEVESLIYECAMTKQEWVTNYVNIFCATQHEINWKVLK